MNLTDKISDNFTYGEVINSKTAKDHGMDNNVPSELLPNVQQLADMILENVRKYFNRPIKITSWYRCPALNAMISSNPNSQHTKGEAVDFIIPGITNFDIASYIKDELAFDQLILEYSWVHCSFVSQENRMDVLRTINGIEYLKGLT